MSDFDNLYLCPNCGNVGALKIDDLVCEKCNFESCYVARHINEGTRKFWIKREESLGNWRFEKRFSTMIKDTIPDDKVLIKAFIKSVKELFRKFQQNKNNLQEIFPEYTRDYLRTTGKRNRGWESKRPPNSRTEYLTDNSEIIRSNRKKSITMQKQSSLRGIIYEGAMNKFCEEHELFEPILIPIPYYDDLRELQTDYEPDFWFKYNDEQIPVEFKTFEKGKMVKSKFIRGIKQSRRYGHISALTHNNPKKYSAIIVCCPEERKFSCAIVDDNIKRM